MSYYIIDTATDEHITGFYSSTDYEAIVEHSQDAANGLGRPVRIDDRSIINGKLVVRTVGMVKPHVPA